MEEKQKTLSATGFSGKYLVASLFILSGILLFARNMGWITAELFSTIVSWYSLFIILASFPQLFYPLMTRQFFAIFMKSLKTSVCHESLGRTFQA